MCTHNAVANVARKIHKLLCAGGEGGPSICAGRGRPDITNCVK